ncbi:hypothetical protein QQP08_013968 [Theobroma cacao]|nr:hypothetical protein QQP08_013968 [Theobroma cacao]
MSSSAFLQLALRHQLSRAFELVGKENAAIAFGSTTMHIGGCLSMSQLQQAVSQSLLQPIEENRNISCVSSGFLKILSTLTSSVNPFLKNHGWLNGRWISKTTKPPVKTALFY